MPKKGIVKSKGSLAHTRLTPVSASVPGTSNYVRRSTPYLETDKMRGRGVGVAVRAKEQIQLAQTAHIRKPRNSTVFLLTSESGSGGWTSVYA